MKTIIQNYVINAPIDKVWEAFIDPDIIEKWGAGPATMSQDSGFGFSLWGGDIHGKNIEVIPNKIIKQEWITNDWDIPSIVTFTFQDIDGKTNIQLVHENVPDKDEKDIAEGWSTYYIGEIKKLLEP